MEAVSYGILPVRGQSASRFTPLPSIAKVIGIEVTDKIRNSTGQQALLSLTPKSFAGQHGGQPRKSSQSSRRSVPSKPSVNLTGISGSAAVSASHRDDQSRSPGGQRVDGIPPPHTKKKIFHRSVRYGPSKSMRRRIPDGQRASTPSVTSVENTAMYQRPSKCAVPEADEVF